MVHCASHLNCVVAQTFYWLTCTAFRLLVSKIKNSANMGVNMVYCVLRYITFASRCLQQPLDFLVLLEHLLVSLLFQNTTPAISPLLPQCLFLASGCDKRQSQSLWPFHTNRRHSLNVMAIIWVLSMLFSWKLCRLLVFCGNTKQSERELDTCTQRPLQALCVLALML